MKPYKKRAKGSWCQGKSYKGDEGSGRQFSKREIREQLAADEEGYLERHHKGKRTKNMRARLEYRVRWYQEMIDMYGSKMMDGWMRDGLRRAKKELKELEEKEAANSK